MTTSSSEVGFERRNTHAETDPYDELAWETRDAKIENWADSTVAFEQGAVEFPLGWSQNATNIVAQKYFRGQLGTPARETSLRQVVDRVVGKISEWGGDLGYFASSDEQETFVAELKHLLVNQKAAFNSPVWFNIGVADTPQQSSACFILSVDDTIDDILEWYVEEGKIFKGGSGAGVNLSRIRASTETVSGGGEPSGPVSFMRGADASAGAIKSGGKTRRAAKMVILDADHPDIEDFIWTKAREERKARALSDAGFDMTLDGADSFSVQYQNANNSVRVTDAFMAAVEADGTWDLLARTTGEVVRTVQARDLFRQLSEAAWECADPGLQYDTTINRWHTCPNSGRITASNPCSEYVHLENSACNLSSLNLLAYLDSDGTFDVSGFRHGVRIMISAQEMLVSNSYYPTGKIADNAEAFRQLGIGYANLGALLMTLGLPYDSDDGRALAATITAVMTGEAYRTSARIAARLGAFSGLDENREAMLGVLAMHRAAVEDIASSEVVPAALSQAAREVWTEAVEFAAVHGVRNAQVSVLAPTGTISFMMDCDTTGIEPDLALKKVKRLVGGGTMSIVNQSVPTALERLGYTLDQVADIVAHIDTQGSVGGAPHLKDEHVAVFACSMGDTIIEPLGHVKMMSAVQPFLSGAISKTANLPETATVEDVEQLYMEAWKLGVKALAVYRDNAKLGQPLSVDKQSTDDAIATAAEALLAEAPRPVRERLARSRRSRTFEFRVADCKGFVTVGEYEDGRPGEIFVRVSKQGSTLAGIMDAFAIAISHGLQYGVPLDAYVRAFVGMRFEPAGMTDDPDLRISSSLIDYIFRRMAVEYLSYQDRADLNIFTTHERMQPTLPGVEEAAAVTAQGVDVDPDPPSSPRTAAQRVVSSDAPLCMQCGTQMHRAGSCFACASCGNTSGCS